MQLTRDHDAHDALLMQIGTYAVLVAFIIETGTNAVGGYREAGVGLALLLMAVAVFGALCGVLYRREAASLYLVAAVICFLVSQVAGNSVFSTMLADGSVKRASEARSGASASDNLQRLRDELKQIGITRPVSAIEPDERLECSRTSSAYKDGVGPKCTAYRVELAKARRAAELPGLISDANERVLKGPQKAEGEGFVGQLRWMLTKTFGEPGDDDLKRGLVAFFVFVLGLIANVGPAIILGGGSKPATGDASFDGLQRHPPLLLADRSADVEIVRPSPLAAAVTAAGVSSPTAAVPSPGQLVPVGGGSTPQAQSYGAPININVGSAVPSHGQPVAIAAPTRVGEAPALAPRHDVGRVPSAPPVDRAPINALSDSLAAFRAACLADVPGGHVTAGEIYRRYVSWKGPSAIGEAAFHAMFAPIAGIPALQVGGQTHYHNVALRAPELAAVS